MDHTEMIDILMQFRFANEGWCLTTPLLMMGIDIFVGTVHAMATKTFQSSRMRIGLSKKTGEIAILLIGELLSFSMGLPRYVMSCVSAYIIFMEFMSIMENCEKSGVPIPKSIKNIVNNMDESFTEDDYKALTTKLNEALKTVEYLEDENKKRRGDQ